MSSHQSVTREKTVQKEAIESDTKPLEGQCVISKKRVKLVLFHYLSHISLLQISKQLNLSLLIIITVLIPKNYGFELNVLGSVDIPPLDSHYNLTVDSSVSCCRQRAPVTIHPSIAVCCNSGLMEGRRPSEDHSSLSG